MMAALNISYDRGVVKRQNAAMGVEVYMYIDTPGVYLNAFGTPVSDELAAGAGYDVTTLAKQKLKKERIAQALKIIDTEMEPDGPVRNIVEESAGFKVIDIGVGRHIVEDPDGNNLTAAPLPKEQAVLLLKQLVPKVAEPHPAQVPGGFTKQKKAPIPAPVPQE